MRWLSFLILGGLASAAMADSADSVRVCYNYGCLVEQEVHYSDSQLTQLRDLIGIARNAEEERERLSLAIGQLLAWAGEQSPISADRGGNFADDGVYGRMDCIDHSTTTTLLLQLLADHGWLHFHRVAEPAWRVRYLFELHYSAQIEELAAPTADGGFSWEKTDLVDRTLPAVEKNSTGLCVLVTNMSLTTSSSFVAMPERPLPPRFCARNVERGVRLI